ncbi:hypothetical protein F5Y19DRAFT_475629 [Xylariaceae sp. FL1651]|nr:hypothetical protein F5Y19DRAFT_475629 [Xylariaceae sp. FL1651]
MTTTTNHLAIFVFCCLFLDRLAHFPNGEYTFKIVQLHKQYDPVVRIGPYELHISDPTVFENLYRQDAKGDKYARTADAFEAHGATLFTIDHGIRKARHQPLTVFSRRPRYLASRISVTNI